MNAPNGTNTYTWNDRGGLLAAAGPGGAATFTYDDDGLVTQRTDVTGTATFGYVKGRLDWISDSITGQARKLGYDAAGGVKTVDYGSGRIRTFGYDDFGRLTSDTLRNNAGQQVAQITYGFDLNGRLEQQEHHWGRWAPATTPTSTTRRGGSPRRPTRPAASSTSGTTAATGSAPPRRPPPSTSATGCWPTATTRTPTPPAARCVAVPAPAWSRSTPSTPSTG